MALLGAQFVNAVSPNPVGSLQAYAGASAPSGWLLCNGTSYSTSVYPELFSVLGYTYGGSGANFNVPDLRGRMPIGSGNDGTAANNATRTRGDKGGDTRLQSHGHAFSPETNTAVFSSGGGATGFDAAQTAGSRGYRLLIATVGAHDQAQGSGGNMPPFLVTNYIIKAIPDAPRSGLAYGSTPPIVTALPANPQFGDVVTYIADATNGVAWNLQYDASGTYPWKFIGGAPLSASTTSGTSSYSGTSFALAASGNLSVSLPLAGDYWTTLTLLGTNGTAGAWWMAGLSGPGSAAIDQQAARTIQHATGNWWSNGAVSCYRTFTSTGTVEVQYRVTSGTAQFAERGFSLTPVRVKAA